MADEDTLRAAFPFSREAILSHCRRSFALLLATWPIVIAAALYAIWVVDNRQPLLGFVIPLAAIISIFYAIALGIMAVEYFCWRRSLPRGEILFEEEHLVFDNLVFPMAPGLQIFATHPDALVDGLDHGRHVGIEFKSEPVRRYFLGMRPRGKNKKEYRDMYADYDSLCAHFRRAAARRGFVFHCEVHDEL